MSERAWQRMEATKNPRYYFDLRKERKAAVKGESAFTPATALMAGLLAALDYIGKSGDGDLAVGRDALIHNAETCAVWCAPAPGTWTWIIFAHVSRGGCDRSAATAGVDSSALVKEFREHFAIVVANGQGEMKGKMIRIAHLGYYDYLDTIGILAALEHVLASVTGKPVEYGAAVRAAQEVYARSAAEKRQPVGA